MSKIKAALVALMLGSSAAAMASPAVSFSASAGVSFTAATQASFDATVRDHRIPTAYPMPVRNQSWVSLGSMSLRRGRATITPSLANITALRLQAEYGMSRISSVQLRFRDGAMQTIAVNRVLTTNAPIDLGIVNHRGGIASITMLGTGRNATVDVFAKGYAAELPPVYQPPQPPVYQPPQPPVYQPPVYQGLALGSGMSFLGTDGRRFLEVGADKGTFSKLHLEGDSGTTYIEMVKISFANGQEQMLTSVDQTLACEQSIDIPLDGHGQNAVLQVTVWTNDSGRAITTSTGTFKASLL
jgi:hypothetical protein